MIIAGDVLVSDSIVEAKFHCDLCRCKGACCVLGDAGAPLEKEEVGILEGILEDITPFMRQEGIDVIDREGIIAYDADGSYVTPLVNGEECVFAYFEAEIALCAIEKAWKAGVTGFQKPVSCHLYPLRISTFNKRDAMNYHHWSVCDSARQNGLENATPLYVFAKDALLRKYGQQWYDELLRCIKSYHIL
ncbi:MAG: DUF3109 family protein [Bacteroidales bacterium]